MIDNLKEIMSFGLDNVLIISLSSLALLVAFLKGWEYLCNFFGIETKRSLKEKKRDEDIKKLQDEVKALQCSADKFNSDRIHDREQSRGYQNQWIEVVHEMSAKQDKLIERVDALAEQNRKYQLADTRETLLQAHRYYTSSISNPLKKWTNIEAHAWNEQYETYKDNGGNGYMESDVKPDMDKLDIVRFDDYESMAELMTSRSQCNK